MKVAVVVILACDFDVCARMLEQHRWHAQENQIKAVGEAEVLPAAPEARPGGEQHLEFCNWCDLQSSAQSERRILADMAPVVLCLEIPMHQTVLLRPPSTQTQSAATEQTPDLLVGCFCSPKETSDKRLLCPCHPLP